MADLNVSTYDPIIVIEDLSPTKYTAMTVKKNNAETAINMGGGFGEGVTTLVVDDASKLPTSLPFYVTLWDEGTYPDPTDDSDVEIVKVTAISTNDLTVIRGQGGTSDVAHDDDEAVKVLIVAGHFDEIVSELVKCIGHRLGKGFDHGYLKRNVDWVKSGKVTIQPSETDKAVVFGTRFANEVIVTPVATPSWNTKCWVKSSYVANTGFSVYFEDSPSSVLGAGETGECFWIAKESDN